MSEIQGDKLRAFLNAKVELERAPSFIACHERNVLKLAQIVGDLEKSDHAFLADSLEFSDIKSLLTCSPVSLRARHHSQYSVSRRFHM